MCVSARGFARTEDVGSLQPITCNKLAFCRADDAHPRMSTTSLADTASASKDAVRTKLVMARCSACSEVSAQRVELSAWRSGAKALPGAASPAQTVS